MDGKSNALNKENIFVQRLERERHICVCILVAKPSSSFCFAPPSSSPDQVLRSSGDLSGC